MRLCSYLVKARLRAERRGGEGESQIIVRLLQGKSSTHAHTDMADFEETSETHIQDKTRQNSTCFWCEIVCVINLETIREQSSNQ